MRIDIMWKTEDKILRSGKSRNKNPFKWTFEEMHLMTHSGSSECVCLLSIYEIKKKILFANY